MHDLFEFGSCSGRLEESVGRSSREEENLKTFLRCNEQTIGFHPGPFWLVTFDGRTV